MLPLDIDIKLFKQFILNLNGIKPFLLEYNLLNTDKLQTLVDKYENEPIILHEISDNFDLVIKADPE